MTKLSVLVRSHNDSATIRQTLESILSQKCSLPFHVLVCDDASIDGTLEMVQSFSQVTLVPRPAGPYKPGRTLNHFIRHCEGDIVVFNNADAIPLHQEWLETLVRPLVEQRAEAVFANQVPRSDAQWLVRKDSYRAFGDGTISQSWRAFFSLASSAIPRALLIAMPFSEKIQYSEDVEWVVRTKARVVYVPESRVEHSHNYTFAELKKRFYGEGYADAQIHHDCPSLPRQLASALAETLRDGLFILRHPAGWRELFTAPVRRLIMKVYYWKGCRDCFKNNDTVL